ncbi:hypothetical protein EG329_011989 [Mollisiaceae sp. DMI_Dod_QoI]|nr:hypothetical protein EG329_011989 [Helotiales sp. DMI_Dod_QoI]
MPVLPAIIPTLRLVLFRSKAVSNKKTSIQSSNSSAKKNPSTTIKAIRDERARFLEEEDSKHREELVADSNSGQPTHTTIETSLRLHTLGENSVKSYAVCPYPAQGKPCKPALEMAFKVRTAAEELVTGKEGEEEAQKIRDEAEGADNNRERGKSNEICSDTDGALKGSDNEDVGFPSDQSCS